MKTELLYLTLVTVLTGLLWVPYIIDRVLVRGLIDAVGYPAPQITFPLLTTGEEMFCPPYKYSQTSAPVVALSARSRPLLVAAYTTPLSTHGDETIPRVWNSASPPLS